jgi:hypothetical protein
MRTTFSTPVTPTRESPSAIPGTRAWTSSPAPNAGEIEEVGEPACTVAKPSARPERFARGEEVIP